ncbi:MAG: hypothetical protein ACPGRX_07530 [Bdellovibrionales bacterium]
MVGIHSSLERAWPSCVEQEARNILGLEDCYLQRISLEQRFRSITRLRDTLLCGITNDRETASLLNDALLHLVGSIRHSDAYYDHRIQIRAAYGDALKTREDIISTLYHWDTASKTQRSIAHVQAHQLFFDAAAACGPIPYKAPPALVYDAPHESGLADDAEFKGHLSTPVAAHYSRVPRLALIHSDTPHALFCAQSHENSHALDLQAAQVLMTNLHLLGVLRADAEIEYWRRATGAYIPPQLYEAYGLQCNEQLAEDEGFTQERMIGQHIFAYDKKLYREGGHLSL